MKKIDIKIVNLSKWPNPSYKTAGSVGVDLQANLDETIEIISGDRMLIPTGLYIAIPEGYEGQIRPRSGLALKNGITVLNSPGTIDSDYRGEIGVLLINLSVYDTFAIRDGDRIGQLIVSPCAKVNFVSTDKLPSSERDIKGFGHTGI
jgi:dUTP pyrophosphatase